MSKLKLFQINLKSKPKTKLFWILIIFHLDLI